MGGRLWARQQLRLGEVAGQRSAETFKQGRYIMGRMPWMDQSNGGQRRWQGGDREGVSACGSKQFPARLEAANEKGTM
jgi:hypothetical protein